EGVGHVVGDVVIGGGDGGDPALGAVGVGGRGYRLGHHSDLRRGRQGERGGQPGDPGADHQYGPHRSAFGLAASIRSRARRAGSATSGVTCTWLTTSPSIKDSSTHAR